MEPEPNEAELARRARDGDQEALSELVEGARLRLFAHAYAELRHYEDAHDAVAAALLRVCRHIHELQEPERVRAWMQSIARNEARRILQRRAAAPVSLEELDSVAGTAAEPSVLRLDIERALRQLPRDEARALALFYLARLPIHEIAHRTGRPEGTIKRWLHLGRRRLATTMEGYAPMTPPMTATTTTKAAAIVSTDMGWTPEVLQSLVDALKGAGWEDVSTVGAVPLVEKPANGGPTEFHVTEPLQGRRFIVLDEWVGGRSAFELHILLRATVEAKEMVFGLLAASPTESTLWAAWAAGFDLFLTKPVDPAEFGEFGRRILADLTSADGAPSG
jgi:RNA polymerase sigma factor (sigma-70 family)